MRHFFKFENRRQPLATAVVFSSRLLRSGMVAFVVIVMAQATGMLGYHFFEGMDAVDAFANAALILSGEGPLTPLRTDGGKLFAGVYAIVSELLVFALAGLILAPVLHRVLHRFHVDDDAEK